MVQASLQPATGVPAPSDSTRQLRQVPATAPSVLLVAAIDTLGIARLPRVFRKAGARVSVLAQPGIAALRSRYVSERIVPAAGMAPLAEELGKRLRDRAKQHDLVILCDEMLMRYIATLPDFDNYASAYPVPAEDRYVVLSNVQFISRAQSLGISTPNFEVCIGAAQGRESAARLGYPVMLKADFGLAGSGVRLLQSEGDWNIVDIPLDQAFLLQTYISGQTGATNILFNHGTPICWFSFYKMYNWPNRFSPSGGGDFVHNDQIGRFIDLLGKVVPFHGLCSVDWVEECSSGRIFVIELNPRPTPSLYAGTAAGVDFSRALNGLLRGQPIIQRPLDVPRKRGFLMFPESAYHAIDNRDLRLFTKSLAAIRFDDPRLLLLKLRRMLTYYTRRSLAHIVHR